MPFYLRRPLVAFSLQPIHLPVNTAFFHQLGMGTGFGNGAFVEHDNLIGVFYGAETVRNDDNGFTFYKCTDGVLNERFVFRVEGGGRFVQKDDWCILEESAGDGKPLAFSAGEGIAVFADFRVVALRQFFDKRFALRGFCGDEYLLFCRISVANQNIVVHCIIKEHHVLEYNRKCAQQGFRVYRRNIDAADADRSR